VEPGNPEPAGTGIRLPGSRNAEQYNWVVTSAGGRDHFLVYVSPQRLADFEQLLAALPRAQVGRPIENVPLLPEGEQTADGVWARRITFENPIK
jgi:hypothetical protein